MEPFAIINICKGEHNKYMIKAKVKGIPCIDKCQKRGRGKKLSEK